MARIKLPRNIRGAVSTKTGIRIKWFGPSAEALLNKTMAERFLIASFSFRDFIKSKISKPSPPPSKPGEFLHRQKSKKGSGKITQARGGGARGGGHLFRNIVAEVDKRILESRVGTNVTYGKFWEIDARPGKKRKWLSMALSDFMGRMKRIMEGRGF